jgi:HEAT repeat protein
VTEDKAAFQSILEGLFDENNHFARPYLQRYSDLDPKSLQALLEIWPRLKPARKLLLLDGLLALLDSDTLVSFDDLGRALLTDGDAAVRSRALRLLSECDDPKFVPTLISILQNDSEIEPRLEAATLLGEFVMLGELEELPEKEHHAAVQALLDICAGNQEPKLHRRALEALGYSSRPEVRTLIESAYQRTDPQWVASALTAMGRSSDEHWEDQVVRMLLNDDPRVHLAAVEAAGELSLDAARPILLKTLGEAEEDEITSAAIWSLSQIGGEDVRVVLEYLLDQAENDEQIEFLEDALDNLAFTEDSERFDLLAYDAEDDHE